MQDVDFELIFEPGRDTADSIDLLSRYLLPEIDKDDSEKRVNMIINYEHGLVMRSINQAPATDVILQEVLKIMKMNDWERHKNRPEK